MKTWAEFIAEFGCEHRERQPRVKTTSNGLPQWWMQCVLCGHGEGPIKKTDPRVLALVERVPYDEVLHQQYHTELTREYTRQKQLERDVETNAWWAEYNDYLQSGDWQRRRQMVLERDGKLCQACRREEATQVHHLSYRYGMAAPLFELISVCAECHDAMTRMDRERRAS